ncbi:MAG: nucleotidyltransferase family protein [Candidatus Yanofskybacteria bacterium]|nr:nucleotidyltransferase family protein [Candidatus Yanofskybacteria bacterium]
MDSNIYSIIDLLKENGVEYAGVFGSFSRGEDSPNSDIDILVRFKEPKSLLDLVRIKRIVENKTGRKIDLVTEGGLSSHILPRILPDLKDIYGQR